MVLSNYYLHYARVLPHVEDFGGLGFGDLNAR